MTSAPRGQKKLNVLLDALGGEMTETMERLRVQQRGHHRVIGSHHERGEGERAHT